MKVAKKKPEKRIKAPPGWEDRPDSFERFESLARGLLGVQKKELDKDVLKRRKPKRRAA